MLTEMLKEFFGLAVCQQEMTPVQVDDGPVLPAVLQAAARQDPLRQGPAHRRDGGEAADREGVRLGVHDRRGGRVPVPADAGGGLPARAAQGLPRGAGVGLLRGLRRPRCPQQKCLIHLMRDMNQELLNNPFDAELQSITGPFGTLLRAIVATIDQHGLKRRYLGKHERERGQVLRVSRDAVLPVRGRRGPAERLLKNRDKLFTFIQHDGVPWNNNNAENAIRRFAYYREDTPGR